MRPFSGWTGLTAKHFKGPWKRSVSLLIPHARTLLEGGGLKRLTSCNDGAETHEYR